MNNLASYQTFYFIGIGGIGMSALARYFHASGQKVLGYDRTDTKLTRALQGEGMDIQFTDEISEQISVLDPADTLIIYTPAIKKLGILDFFKERNFTVLKRAEILGRITRDTTCLAVAGTHGKTTTSSLLAHLCKVADLPFSCFLGGIAENFKSNFFFNGRDISVVEADEYDRSFLHLSPDWAIVTSIDADHLDIYGDRETIENSFRQFAALIPDDRQLLVRKGIDTHRKSLTYAVNEVADYYSDNIQEIGAETRFDFHHATETIPGFTWEIPGIHNVENATAAIALLSGMGVDFDTLKRGISTFKGIKRRYTKHILNSKIYVDDYAHHPTELDAVIGSIKTFYPEQKLLVVFQPHLFSRTRDFADEFAGSLAKADELILLDIYPARELQENYEGITSAWLLDKIALKQKQNTSLQAALEEIKTKDFDILLTVGAGNIDTLYDPIVEWLGKDKK